MNFYWIYEIATWQLGALIILLTVALALAGLLLTRSMIQRAFLLSKDANEGVNGFFSGVGVFYGLLLGLVAVATWGSYDKACDLVSSEASAVVGLYRDVSCFPPPEKGAMQRQLRRYLDDVIHVAWPAYRKGELPSVGSRGLTELQKALTGFHPASLEQQALQTETLRAFNHLAEARRLRVDAVTDGLPPILWFVVLAGAVLTIATTYFFYFQDIKTYMVLTTFLAIFIGMMLFLIAAIDNPFRGSTGVTADSYIAVLEGLGDLDIDGIAH
jgi:hypothetical protein